MNQQKITILYCHLSNEDALDWESNPHEYYNLQYVAAKIAEVRGISAEDAARITLENGRGLFGI